MRVCGSFPNSPCARATTVLGLEHFRATADGGVLALSFVTALLARPWKVGVPCQDHLRECSRRAVYRRASKHQIVGKSWHFFGGVGAERPRRPRAGAWHRPKSPASTAWTFSLAISGECELDCSGTIDARFCAWRTPGGVKSVNLCELSVPGTEARCRANHGSARCSRAGATAGGRTEMRGWPGPVPDAARPVRAGARTRCCLRARPGRAVVLECIAGALSDGNQCPFL